MRFLVPYRDPTSGLTRQITGLRVLRQLEACVVAPFHFNEAVSGNDAERNIQFQPGALVPVD